MSRLAVAVALVVGALSGCGGGGEDIADTPPTKSTKAAQGTTVSPTNTTTRAGGTRKPRQPAARDPRLPVEAVLTSSDPADACGRFVTQHYLRVAYGGRHGCVQAQAPGSAADRFDLKRLRIDGGRATAVVVPSGGPYDGERVTVSLVRDGPRWAVDALEAKIPVGP